MKNKFDELIQSLSDHELAVFSVYQYEGLLATSKEKLKNELTFRGLTKTQIADYSNRRLYYTGTTEEEETCERCGSNIFFNDIDIELLSRRYWTSVYEFKTNRCRICHLNTSKEPPKNFFKRVKWYLFEKNKKKSKQFIKRLDWFDT
jgi:hypothetical protein